jgi:hypothetical protein
MKIKVEKSETTTRIQFPGTNYTIYLFHEEIERLSKDSWGVACDLSHTVRANGHRLFFYHEDQVLFSGRLDTKAFFTACMKIPTGKPVEMDVKSFNKIRMYGPDVMNTVQLINHPNFNKSCIHVLRNAAVKGWLWQLQPILSRYVQAAEVFPDGYGKDEMSFYFNGRMPGGCGYNGGIIFHGAYDGYGNGGAPTFSVSLDSDKQITGYSVHT